MAAICSERGEDNPKSFLRLHCSEVCDQFTQVIADNLFGVDSQ